MKTNIEIRASQAAWVQYRVQEIGLLTVGDYIRHLIAKDRQDEELRHGKIFDPAKGRFVTPSDTSFTTEVLNYESA